MSTKKTFLATWQDSNGNNYKYEFAVMLDKFRENGLIVQWSDNHIPGEQSRWYGLKHTVIDGEFDWIEIGKMAWREGCVEAFDPDQFNAKVELVYSGDYQVVWTVDESGAQCSLHHFPTFVSLACAREAVEGEIDWKIIDENYNTIDSG